MNLHLGQGGQKGQGSPLAASVARREFAEEKVMRPLAPICRSASSRSFTLDLQSDQMPTQALALSDGNNGQQRHAGRACMRDGWCA